MAECMDELTPMKSSAAQDLGSSSMVIHAIAIAWSCLHVCLHASHHISSLPVLQLQLAAVMEWMQYSLNSNSNQYCNIVLQYIYGHIVPVAYATYIVEGTCIAIHVYCSSTSYPIQYLVDLL